MAVQRNYDFLFFGFMLNSFASLIEIRTGGNCVTWELTSLLNISVATFTLPLFSVSVAPSFPHTVSDLRRKYVRCHTA